MARSDHLSILPPALRVAREPEELNLARCLSPDEMAELTCMSADYWRQQIRDGRIASVPFGEEGRNQRRRVRLPTFLAYLEQLEGTP